MAGARVFGAMYGSGVTDTPETTVITRASRGSVIMARTRSHEASVVQLLAALATFLSIEARADQPHTVVVQSTSATVGTGKRPIAERIKSANLPVRITSEEQLAPNEGLIRKLAEETLPFGQPVVLQPETDLNLSPAVVEFATDEPEALTYAATESTGAGGEELAEPATMPPPQGLVLPSKPISSAGDVDVRSTASVEVAGVVEQADLQAGKPASEAKVLSLSPTVRKKPVVVARPRQLTPFERLQSRLADFPRPLGFLPAPRPSHSRPGVNQGRGPTVTRNGVTRGQTQGVPDSGPLPSQSAAALTLATSVVDDTQPLSSCPEAESGGASVIVAERDIVQESSAIAGDMTELATTELATTEVATTEVATTEVATTEAATTEVATTEVATTERAPAEESGVSRGSDGAPLPVVHTAAVVCDVVGPGRALSPGERADLKCLVRNVGSAAVENISVTVFFAEGLEPVAVAGRSADIFEDQIRFTTVGALPPGGVLPLRIAAVARGTGQYTYRAHVRHRGSDSPAIRDGMVCTIPGDLSSEAALVAATGNPEGTVGEEQPEADRAVDSGLGTDSTDNVDAIGQAVETGTPHEDLAASERVILVHSERNIDVSVKVPEGVVRRGERFELRFTVCNTGSEPAHAVTPMFHFGKGIEPVAVVGRALELTSEGSVLFEQLDELAPGKSVEFAIIAACVEVGTVPFQGVVWCGAGEGVERVPVVGEIRVVPERIATAPEGRTQR